MVDHVDNYLLGGSIREISKCPQAVLHQSLAGACKVFTQSLHPACKEQMLHPSVLCDNLIGRMDKNPPVSQMKN